MKAHRYPPPSFIHMLTVAMMIGGALAQEEDKQQPVPDSESAAKKLEREAEIAEPPPGANPVRPAGKPDAQMQAVLDELAALGGNPLPTLKADDAREQPTPADAVKKVMEKQDKKGPEKVAKVDDISIELTGHDIKGRIYKPEGDGPHPVILYIHGGGWVIADLDTYDATPRALCNATDALVSPPTIARRRSTSFPQRTRMSSARISGR